MDYVFWKSVAEPGQCVCEGLQGFDDEHLIAYGQPVADRFPVDTRYLMSRERRRDKKLGDVIDNHDSYIVVSPSLKEFLKVKVAEPMEFLPTTIVDHGGKVVATDYTIVNLLTFHDAIDLEQSEVKWNTIDPEKISRFRKLVLATDRIPPDCNMLRLKHFPNRLLLRRELAVAIKRCSR